MANQNPIPRDVQLPGQDIESPDLNPSIEPEREGSPTDSDVSDDDTTSEVPASETDTADSDPELGNTLIEPNSS